jgi:hypothetical protein
MAEKVVPFSDALEERVKKEFGEEATPEFMNLLRLGKAAYEHGYHGFIPRKKLLKWVSMMYDSGENQMKIMHGKAHGSITLNSYDVINAGGYLSLFGKREGLLS